MLKWWIETSCTVLRYNWPDLRSLMSLSLSVCPDRPCLSPPQETRRNTLIKDGMREQCIPALVESWFQILQTYQHTHSELTCQCLEVVGAYVSWIDLNLIANDRSECVNLLFSLCSEFSLSLSVLSAQC